MHATGTSAAVGVLFSTQHASSVSVRANGLLHNCAVACILILISLMCTRPIFFADITGVSTVRSDQCRVMSDTTNAARVAVCALSKGRCCHHLLGCSKSIGPPPIFFYHTACHQLHPFFSMPGMQRQLKTELSALQDTSKVRSAQGLFGNGD